ncbi:MAG TPA: nucleotidyltransferase domain-containing protein [Solirubrobacteraceae bacterium]|nr:nucleotidyltransferase domain-containing protein [Solirubrobacteraceae bacterium]
MGLTLLASAETLGCSERTLRRYINDGLLHGRSIASRPLELPAAEERYLRSHWTLLSKLRRALRTERDVRLAVLFGSTAIGEDNPVSDVDLLIAHRRTDSSTQAALALRLRRALGKPVDIVQLEHAEAAPSLLADVLQEGRVLIDRDGLWDVLGERRQLILAAAEREDQLTATRARESVAAARARLAAPRERAG